MFAAVLKLPMLIGMLASRSCEIVLPDAADAVSMVERVRDDLDGFRQAANPHREGNGQVLADADVEITLRARGEAGQLDFDFVQAPE